MENQERQFSPRVIIAGVFIIALLPFLTIEVFRPQLYGVMGPAAYLVYHNLVEMLSVVACLSIFGVGWFTFEQSNDRHALFLSGSFLAIGITDFMHMLSYTGMPAFVTPNSPNKSMQIWIAVRFFTASAFLVSAYINAARSWRWLTKPFLLTIALVFPLLVFTGVTFLPSSLPLTFINGEGLTQFKKNAEYVIAAVLILAAWAYWKRMIRSGDRTLILLIAAFVLSVFKELVFAIYQSEYDSFNVLGHVYKSAAFLLIYWQIFTTSVKVPYGKMREARQALTEDVAIRQRMEESLKEQYSTLHGILDSTNAPIFSVDRWYRYTSFNQAHAEVMRAIYGTQIKLGQSLLDSMTVQEDREKAKKNIDRALTGEQHVESAYSGEEVRSRRYFEVSHNPIQASEHSVIGVAVISLDTTERKQADEEMKRHMQELERFNRVIVDRELRMIELKKEINELAGRLGRPAPYQLDFLEQTSHPELQKEDRHEQK